STPRPTRPVRPGRRGSERVVDAGEHRDALRSLGDVDEADDLRPDDTPEAKPIVPVQVAEGVGAEAVKNLSRLDERRHLELEVDAEEWMVPDARAQLGLAHRAVEVREPVPAEPTQPAVPPERAHLPPGRAA